mmetsp:Transcript_46781/g.83864  ORF Transcript_46781/g.83864 Transcript_46781/m.83864 type:complete len:121 (+) Transcript_46781:2-364(+)
MHFIVPDECRPILLNAGARVKFPLPTKKLAAPKKAKRAAQHRDVQTTVSESEASLSLKQSTTMQGLVSSPNHVMSTVVDFGAMKAGSTRLEMDACDIDVLENIPNVLDLPFPRFQLILSV